VVLAVWGAPVAVSADVAVGRGEERGGRSAIHELLERVNDRNIRFGTYTPDHHAPWDRRVFVGGPPEAVTLIGLGRREVLDALVDALSDTGRAWAAQVMLARLTITEGRIVDTYSADPAGWYRIFGDSAHAYWRQWLDEHRSSLSWDAAARVFRVMVPDAGARD
jgi:hypothetical protein